MRQVVVDTETTGLSHLQGHRIVELGAVEIEDRRLTGRTFHAYVNPEREIDAGAFKIHGLSRFFLTGHPTFPEVADGFVDFVRGAELIAHNLSFDVGFLNYELHRADRYPIDSVCPSVLDTLPLARRLHPGKGNTLGDLCKRYKVDLRGRDKHGALKDAELLAKVYLLMTQGQGDLELFSEQTEVVYVDRRGLLVLRATEDELLAHQALLAEMKAPVWA